MCEPCPAPWRQIGVDPVPQLNVNTPIEVVACRGLSVVSLAAGEFHSVALTDAGLVYTWGAGGEGQLGHGKVS